MSKIIDDQRKWLNSLRGLNVPQGSLTIGLLKASFETSFYQVMITGTVETGLMNECSGCLYLKGISVKREVCKS